MGTEATSVVIKRKSRTSGASCAKRRVKIANTGSDITAAIASRADAVLVIGSANSSNTLALEKVARNVGCPTVQRINGVEELDEAALAGARIVGVTAGASAPEDVVQAVIARLAPRDGVEEVDVTDEEEYFPPPRTLREVMPVLDAVAALATGGSPPAAAALGGSFSADRAVNASDTLAALEG